MEQKSKKPVTHMQVRINEFEKSMTNFFEKSKNSCDKKLWNKDLGQYSSHGKKKK